MAIAVRRAGLQDVDGRLTMHILRFGCGSYLADELGWPFTSIAKYLGHKDPAFTARVYTHSLRSQKDMGTGLLRRFAMAVGS